MGGGRTQNIPSGMRDSCRVLQPGTQTPLHVYSGPSSVGNRCHGGCDVGRLLTSIWCFTGWSAAQDMLVVSKAWRIGPPVGNSATHLPGGDETNVLVVTDVREVVATMILEFYWMGVKHRIFLQGLRSRE